ncbi:MAG TPA: ABC transporter substrate-binding protein [Burkholderiales bacterium]|jgi:NitT/TauT family transport system substrate-binding protein|nr:ABC transporter substrate-binding protein [Burkholderiales bacterium]
MQPTSAAHAASLRRRFLKRLSAVPLGALGALPAIGAHADSPVRFALNRGPYDSSNAPFLLARERGWFAAEGLAVDLSLSKNVVDAIRRVASNECDFGYADFSVVTRFAAEHPESAPHLLYSIFDRSPAAIVTWKSSGVRTVADLHGKTLAATVGDGAYQLFPAFCRANKIDPKSVKILEVGLEEREEVMHERKVDGAIGFDSTILYKLVHMGARRDAVGFLHYADAGLPLYSNGIIVSRKALVERKAQIAGLLRACARGWQAALHRPAAMLAVLAAANPKADMALESERFEWIREQQIATANVRKNGMGTIERARFERIASFLLPGTPIGPLSTLIESSYLPAAELRAV